MHQAVRARVEDDVRVLEGALTAIEATPEGKSPAMQRALDELRQLRKRKEDSLEAPPIDRMTTSSNSEATARWRATCRALTAQARRVCAALTRQRPCRNRPGRKQQA